MAYHPRIETSNIANLITTKSRNAELWFVNNKKLEESILGYLAKYSDRYKVKTYAFAIEGNHTHLVALFPRANRASFMRDFNSTTAKAVSRHVPKYPGGRFFARRYSQEFLPGDEDTKEYFFYTVLQPVQDGLVEDIRDYPGYNCFWDAINDTRKTYEVIDWSGYNDALRWNKKVDIQRYAYKVVLKYERLPGYEHLSQEEYKQLMLKELSLRQKSILRQRREQGKYKAAGKNYLKNLKPGSRPFKTKTSSLKNHRPRVLSVCDKRRNECKAWYFTTLYTYKNASEIYRAGDYDAIFPPGTYKPFLPIEDPAEF